MCVKTKVGDTDLINMQPKLKLKNLVDKHRMGSSSVQRMAWDIALYVYRNRDVYDNAHTYINPQTGDVAQACDQHGEVIPEEFFLVENILPLPIIFLPLCCNGSLVTNGKLSISEDVPIGQPRAFGVGPPWDYMGALPDQKTNPYTHIRWMPGREGRFHNVLSVMNQAYLNEQHAGNLLPDQQGIVQVVHSEDDDSCFTYAIALDQSDPRNENKPWLINAAGNLPPGKLEPGETLESILEAFPQPNGVEEDLEALEEPHFFTVTSGGDLQTTLLFDGVEVWTDRKYVLQGVPSLFANFAEAHIVHVNHRLSGKNQIVVGNATGWQTFLFFSGANDTAPRDGGLLPKLEADGWTRISPEGMMWMNPQDREKQNFVLGVTSTATEITLPIPDSNNCLLTLILAKDK